MSFILRTSASLRGPTARAFTSRPAATVSTFHTSSARAALSENDRAQDHPDRDAHIDRHKHDSVGKAKSGQGEWKSELASGSEQNVKADKSNMSMDEMQKLGEKNAEEGKQPSGSASNKT